MNKNEFLRKLKKILSYDLPLRLVEKNLAYYRSYIEEEVRKGRSESEVLKELGDPRLIARTIIDAAEAGKDGIPGSEDDIDFKKEIYGSSGSSYEDTHFDNNDTWSGSSDNGYGESTRNNGSNFWGRDEDDSPQGYFFTGGCLSAILLMLIFFVVFSLIGSLIGFLSPILMPLSIILLIVWLFSRRR